MTQTTSQVEAAAKLIYETWKDIPEYRLWQNGGNSLKQDEARRIARQVIELARPQEAAAPVGVVSVSPLHVGVGWVGGYVPKNGEKLYLAAARVPVASPAEPVRQQFPELGATPSDMEIYRSLAPKQGDAKDADRYRWLRRGQHWSVIDGIGAPLRAETLDAAVDAILASKGSDQGEGK